ncbi:MAG: NlpC/P60 family protein [Bacteroidales bacterium]
MNRRNILNAMFLFTFWFGLSACGTSQHLADSSFYTMYSQKLGINLKGDENKDLIKSVSEWQGTPYKYASCIKQKGTDCSGFVTSVYLEVYGKKLQRSSADMVKDVDFIDRDKMQAGDLLFFKINGKKISHVGIYIADNKFIHASTQSGVVVNDLDQDYYKKTFYRAGRVK